MSDPIPFQPIQDLCDSVGLRTQDVARIIVTPYMVTFTVYGRDEDGKHIVEGEGDMKSVQTHIRSYPLEVP